MSAIRILLQIPIIALGIFTNGSDAPTLMNSIMTLPVSDLVVLYSSSFGIIALSVLIGLLGDFIYKKKVYSDLKNLRETNNMDGFTLASTGGVNLLAAAVSYFAANAVISLITDFLV